MNDRELFYEFNRLSVGYLDTAARVGARIDGERKKLGLKILRSVADLSEPLAKGFALLSMAVVDQQGIPPVLAPWVNAHRTGNAFALVHSCGVAILSEDPDSAIGKMCRAIARRFLPIAKYFSD